MDILFISRALEMKMYVTNGYGNARDEMNNRAIRLASCVYGHGAKCTA